MFTFKHLREINRAFSTYAHGVMEPILRIPAWWSFLSPSGLPTLITACITRETGIAYIAMLATNKYERAEHKVLPNVKRHTHMNRALAAFTIDMPPVEGICGVPSPAWLPYNEATAGEITLVNMLNRITSDRMSITRDHNMREADEFMKLMLPNGKYVSMQEYKTNKGRLVAQSTQTRYKNVDLVLVKILSPRINSKLNQLMINAKRSIDMTPRSHDEGYGVGTFACDGLLDPSACFIAGRPSHHFSEADGSLDQLREDYVQVCGDLCRNSWTMSDTNVCQLSTYINNAPETSECLRLTAAISASARMARLNMTMRAAARNFQHVNNQGVL